MNVISLDNLISKNYKRTSGKEAWRQNLHYAIYAADKIRSTLGPQGAYKLVAYNRGPEQVVKVTKDAIAILDELAIQYPPAVILAESAKMQRQETGDGVATYVIFLSSLLKRADELLTLKMHPNTILKGYMLATDKALEVIEQQARPQENLSSNVLDIVDCKRNLLTPPMRRMILEAYELAQTNGKYDKDNLRFIKKPGASTEESALIKGTVIKKEKAHPNMPDRLRNLRIAVITQRPGINRLEVKMPGEGPVHIELNVKTQEHLRQYRDTVDKLKSESLNRLIKLDANVLLCEQPIDDRLKDKLVTNGIFALERVDRKDTLALSKATGAKIVGQPNQLTETDLGHATQLYTGSVLLEKTVTFEGCRGATFLLRGSTSQAIDEMEVAIQNSMTLLNITATDNKVLAGAGATETSLSQQLQAYAKQFPGKEQVSIEAFAQALLDVPRCLAENYGLNPTDILPHLKQLNADSPCGFGINEQGCCQSVCFEPLRVKRSILRRANEVCQLMLKIDELLISKEIPKFHKK